MNDLVSIIIPVYNVEDYLQDCVLSAVNQTYTNLEIVLVDDGSTDSSGQLCDRYKAQDTRIIVIHQKNGGLSSARNAGLDICKGDYVYFLDSDDYIETTLIERYIAIILAKNADVCRGSCLSFCGDKPKNTICRSDIGTEIFSASEALKMMFMGNKLDHSAAGGLFRKELFNGIRFPHGLLYEDYATTYYIIAKCNLVAYTDDRAYYYRMRPNSIMHASVSKKDMIIFDIVENVNRDIISLFPEVEAEANREALVTYLKFYSRILYSGFHAFEEEQSRVQLKVFENGASFIKSGLASTSDIIKILAFYMGKLPFFLVYRVSDWIQHLRQTQ